MRFLVTGGAGFIGSNFIRYILQLYQNYKVINLDCLTYAGNLENLKDVEKNKNYKFIKGDIRNVTLLKKLIKNIDVLINFAAQTHVDRSIKDSEEFMQTNVEGTWALLEVARLAKNLKLFVQISTDEVYGSIQEGSFIETDPLNPSSPYAASKAAADLLCNAYFVTYKVPIIIIRSTNNFGPYQYPEKIIPLFITNILENKKLPLYGDGLNIRNWIYVLDNVRAIDFLIHKGEVGQIYNVSSDDEFTNLQITEMILKKFNLDNSWIKYVKDRAGHDRRYSIDATKIRSLGWKPIYDFEKSLDATIEWYKENIAWWKKLKRRKF
ncbi:MAG: dTDP-glucose 4,6-dehydratase [Candidatus Omnitrophica bacterium]|nr:dTDP-glucose 4,6-dehydratase [Candidatus Omnitrophota bacterium]